MFFFITFHSWVCTIKNHDTKKYYCILKFIYEVWNCKQLLVNTIQEILEGHIWFRSEWYIGFTLFFLYVMFSIYLTSPTAIIKKF